MNISNSALTEAVYYILLSLLEPRHGYGIMQFTEQLSGGRVRLAAGTLYGAINTMLEKGCGTEPNTRKKEYVITQTGTAVLLGEIARLEELARNGRQLIEQVIRY